MSGTLGRFRIWVSSETERDDVTVWASLVDASTREVLRQTFIEATAGYIPVPRTLIFTSYVVPEGQRLLLQLQVRLSERFPRDISTRRPSARNLQPDAEWCPGFR